MGWNTPERKYVSTSEAVEPPAWAEQIFPEAASEASRLYYSGAGDNPYPGQRVAPPSPQSMWSLGALQNMAHQFSSPYMTSYMQSPTSSMTNLSNMASGGMMGANNPFYAAVQNAMRDTSTAVNQAMSGAGRYGSGAHSDILSRSLGNIATQAYADQYNRDVANMMAANQLIDQTRAQQAQAASGLYSAGSGAAMNALQGSGLVNQYNQNLLNAAQQRWREYDESPWSRLNRFVTTGRAVTDPFLGKSSTGQTTTYPSYNMAANIANLGLAAGGVLKGLYGDKGMFGRKG